MAKYKFMSAKSVLTGPGATYKSKGTAARGTTFEQASQVTSGSTTWISIRNCSLSALNGGWVNKKWVVADSSSYSPAKDSGKKSSGGKASTSPSSTASTGNVTDLTIQDAATPLTELPDYDHAAATALAQAIAAKITALINNRDAELVNLAEARSMRLFGLPHQLTEVQDHRISKTSKLGRMFTETFIIDAPIIFIKPGTSNFLPGMSKEEKHAYTSLFIDIAHGSEKVAANQIANIKNTDDIRYFDFSQKYAEYCRVVNLLCRISAVFLGIQDEKVPWIEHGGASYGTYDWRLYNFSNIYQPQTITQNATSETKGSISALIEQGIKNIDMIVQDDKYIQFYVDASASFSESASNSTSQSVLASATDQLSGIGKEIAWLTGVAGTGGSYLDLEGAVNAATGGIDETIEQLANGNGALSTFLKRVTGTTNQLLAGANFMSPEVWSDSDYGKSYSFTVSLSTPYGSKEPWYINILVPMLHLIALGLPMQTSANSYTAPFLVKAFAPGWFSCDLGIVDSISLDKGGSGDAWSVSGLPTEIRVSVSIKDLYANLALPNDFNFAHFFNNTGLLNFLMINCGVNLSKTGLDDKLGVFANLFANTLPDIVQDATSGFMYQLQDTARNVVSLYKD